MLGWGKGKRQLGGRRRRREDTFEYLLCYTSTYHLHKKVTGKSEGTQAQLLVGFHTAYLHKKPTRPVLQERMRESCGAVFLSSSHELLTLP